MLETQNPILQETEACLPVQWINGLGMNDLIGPTAGSIDSVMKESSYTRTSSSTWDYEQVYGKPLIQTKSPDWLSSLGSLATIWLLAKGVPWGPGVWV